MKAVLIFFLLLGGSLAHAQYQELQGTYARDMGDPEKHLISYTLTLDPSGSFTFHSFTEMKGLAPWTRNEYGKGRWEAVAKKRFSTEYLEVSFHTVSEDFDEKFTLDFEGSIARLLVPSPRSLNPELKPARLKFFKSPIFLD